MAVLGSLTAGEMAFKRDVHDLQHAELDILLQGAGGPRSKAPRKSSMLSGVSRSPLETSSSGTPAGTNWPTRRSTLIFTR